MIKHCQKFHFRIFRHGFLISKHVCAGRHGILVPVLKAETSIGLYQFLLFDLSASWFVGELDCRRVRLSASWCVGELVVGELVCRRVVQLPYHWRKACVVCVLWHDPIIIIIVIIHSVDLLEACLHLWRNSTRTGHKKKSTTTTTIKLQTCPIRSYVATSNTDRWCRRRFKQLFPW